MTSLFDIENIFFNAWGYSVSYLEFLGMVSGVIAVVLSSLGNVYSWPIGIINVVLSFFLFFQVQLYPDMFLQVFFFVTNVIGWWRWTHPNSFEADSRKELRVSFLEGKQLVITVTVAVAGTAAFGYFAENLHELFPAVFTKPSAAPYLDSFITVMSILATFYMIQKKVECWIIWLLVDILATYLYFIRDIRMFSLLYLIFCFIAAFALYNWIKQYRNYSIKKV